MLEVILAWLDDVSEQILMLFPRMCEFPRRIFVREHRTAAESRAPRHYAHPTTTEITFSRTPPTPTRRNTVSAESAMRPRAIVWRRYPASAALKVLLAPSAPCAP